MAEIRNRGLIGRRSAGPRQQTRRLASADVIAARDHWLAQPSSPERTRALFRCRNQMASIRNRVEEAR